ncbi:MAG: hypothetical protein GXO59_02680 [Dictyoglomi bacterium]|nr:hypothetical protein [Dictyoglomota bacterium]
MKRLSSLVFVVIVLSFLVIGCGKTAAPNASSNEGNQEVSEGKVTKPPFVANYSWSMYKSGMRLFNDEMESIIDDTMEALKDPYIIHFNLGSKTKGSGVQYFVMLLFRTREGKVDDPVSAVVNALKKHGFNPKVEGEGYIQTDKGPFSVTYRLHDEKNSSSLIFIYRAPTVDDRYSYGYDLSRFHPYPWHEEHIFDVFNEIGCSTEHLHPYYGRSYFSVLVREKVMKDIEVSYLCDMPGIDPEEAVSTLQKLIGGKVRKIGKNKYELVGGSYKDDLEIISVMAEGYSGGSTILFDIDTKSFEDK